jgi:hypothetical protein
MPYAGTCKHLNFKVDAKVFRLTESEESDKVIGYKADITIHCMDCFHPFQFIGVPKGLSPNQPMASLDLLELRIPIKPL